jgi:hypothetical protein
MTVFTKKEYKNFIKAELKITNVKVKKWLKWHPDGDQGYEAFIEARRVCLPIPECEWSFLVGLHEIGHVSTGERLYSYLMEYNAEKWAIRRAKESYGIICPDYEEDAKNYVKDHLIENLVFSDLRLKKVKPYVLDWIGETQSSLTKIIQKKLKDGSIEMDGFCVDLKYWKEVGDC